MSIQSLQGKKKKEKKGNMIIWFQFLSDATDLMPLHHLGYVLTLLNTTASISNTNYEESIFKWYTHHVMLHDHKWAKSCSLVQTPLTVPSRNFCPVACVVFGLSAIFFLFSAYRGVLRVVDSTRNFIGRWCWRRALWPRPFTSMTNQITFSVYLRQNSDSSWVNFGKERSAACHDLFN